MSTVSYYEIFYIDEEMDKELCFMHAVQVALTGDKAIRTEVEEQDPDESGIIRIHDCYVCKD